MNWDRTRQKPICGVQHLSIPRLYRLALPGTAPPRDRSQTSQPAIASVAILTRTIQPGDNRRLHWNSVTQAKATNDTGAAAR